VLDLATVEHGGAKPWRLWADLLGDDRRQADSVSIAAAIVFGFHRVPNAGVDASLAAAAQEFLQGARLASGGWPYWSGEKDAAIEPTAMAIHALALARPTGWERDVKAAARWLWEHQDELGNWRDSASAGGDVYLTVLVLDAIELANGGEQVTFRHEFGAEREAASAIGRGEAKATAALPTADGTSHAEMYEKALRRAHRVLSEAGVALMFADGRDDCVREGSREPMCGEDLMIGRGLTVVFDPPPAGEHTQAIFLERMALKHLGLGKQWQDQHAVPVPEPIAFAGTMRSGHGVWIEPYVFFEEVRVLLAEPIAILSALVREDGKLRLPQSLLACRRLRLRQGRPTKKRVAESHLRLAKAGLDVREELETYCRGAKELANAGHGREATERDETDRSRLPAQSHAVPDEAEAGDAHPGKAASHPQKDRRPVAGWSHPQTVSRWATLFDIGRKTMGKRLRIWEKDRDARKSGSDWQVAMDTLPESIRKKVT